MTDLPRPPAPAMAGFQPDPSIDPNLVNVFDYELLASERLLAGPLAYFAGGALDERTLNDNRAAFGRRRVVPRVMTDVSAIGFRAQMADADLDLPDRPAAHGASGR
jgi:isopentenyl diphosphate isomerase/L-lactate dehydrogenase-like FMN-dependent dehydrogenase